MSLTFAPSHGWPSWLLRAQHRHHETPFSTSLKLFVPPVLFFRISSGAHRAITFFYSTRELLLHVIAVWIMSRFQQVFLPFILFASQFHPCRAYCYVDFFFINSMHMAKWCRMITLFLRSFPSLSTFRAESFRAFNHSFRFPQPLCGSNAAVIARSILRLNWTMQTLDEGLCRYRVWKLMRLTLIRKRRHEPTLGWKIFNILMNSATFYVWTGRIRRPPWDSNHSIRIVLIGESTETTFRFYSINDKPKGAIIAHKSPEQH